MTTLERPDDLLEGFDRGRGLTDVLVVTALAVGGREVQRGIDRLAGRGVPTGLDAEGLRVRFAHNRRV